MNQQQSFQTEDILPHEETQPQQTLLKASYEGFKANLVPGLIIQAIAITVVISYYFIPEVKTLLNQLGEYKSATRLHSYLFAMISTTLFCGLIPFFVFIIMGRLGKVAWWKQLLFFIVYWVWKGAEVNLLYEGLNWALSDVALPRWAIIAIKVAIDQLLYNPLWACWTCCAGYLLKDLNFDVKTWWHRLDKKFWTFTCPSLLLSTWVVWIPGTACIYSMPDALQIPLFNLVACFFVLVLAFLSAKSVN